MPVKTVPNRPLVAGVAGMAGVAAALLAGAAGAAQAATPGPTATTAPVTVASGARDAVSVPLLPSATPRSYRLKISGQYQATNYYCVPAAGSMSLATFGLKIAQGTLAQKMKTTLKGTGGNEAAKALDGYLHPRHFDDRIVGDVVGRPSVLMERVSYDVGALHRAPVIQVWMERLPWNKGKVVGRLIGHAIVAYGYNKAARTITVFDPWRPTGGPHTLPASALAGTLQTGAGMHYISRLCQNGPTSRLCQNGLPPARRSPAGETGDPVRRAAPGTDPDRRPGTCRTIHAFDPTGS
jgi:hypothetical protein